MVKDDMEELQEKYEVLDEAYKSKKQQLKESNKNLKVYVKDDFSSIIKQDDQGNQSFCSGRTMRSTPDREQEFGDFTPMRNQEFSAIEVIKNEDEEFDDDVLDLGSFIENRKEDNVSESR